MPYSSIFGLEFKTIFVIYEISTLEIFKVQNFVEKIKICKFGTRNASFEYFWLLIKKKTILVFEISTLKFA